MRQQQQQEPQRVRLMLSSAVRADNNRLVVAAVAAVSILLLSSWSGWCEAFVAVPGPRTTTIRLNSNPPGGVVPRQQSYGGSSALFQQIPSTTNVEALRAAAAKAREEVSRLEKQLGKTSSSSAKSAAALNKFSKDELTSTIPTLLAEADVGKQMEQWQDYKANQKVQYFGSADLRSFPVSLSQLEQRTGLTAETLGLIQSEASLDEFKYATLWVAGGSTIAAIASLALLPENIGATLCYAFALVPVAFLAVGSTAPVLIANTIAAMKGNGGPTGTILATNTQDRVCRHEAAHLCCGYWCGLPIARSYSIQEGVARVEFDVATASKYSDTEVAALAVTALAGLVGEALKFGNANGAEQDLMTLEQIMARSNVRLAAAQQNLTRWGALTAAILLRQYEAKYERVVTALKQQMSIADCIAILEE